jgi:hypothetical protein
MARKRRPSIGLIILFIILLLLFFFAGTILNYVSEGSGQGSFVYSYSQGTETVVAIDYELPQTIADAAIFQSPSGWTTSMNQNILSLTGGTLNPGDSITLNYHLKGYIASGTSTVTVTGTTSSGAQIVNQAPLVVSELTLLYIAELLAQNSIWFLILAVIVLIAIIVLFIRGEKKEEITVNVNINPNPPVDTPPNKPT